MESIKIFLDTDVLLNWLCKEVDSRRGLKLWEAPYAILKKVESGELSASTSIINLMEIVFVLRRKKRWSEDEISEAIMGIQEIRNFEIIIPDGFDITSGFNLQSVYMLDPFDAVYFAVVRRTGSLLISRDRRFIEIVNEAEGREIAFSPEDFLDRFDP